MRAWLPMTALGLVVVAVGCEDNPDDGVPAGPAAGQAPAGDGDMAAPGDGDMATPGDGDMAAPGDGDMAAPGDGDMAAPGDGDMAAPGDGDMGTAAGLARIGLGQFAPLMGYEASTAVGVAMLTVGDEGTHVSLQVNGLTPDTAYPAHVHALPCALSGGGHYLIDTAVTDAVETNEIWPQFTTDAEGNATAMIETTHVARADAMAVVIHDPAAENAKMLCADLTTEGFDTATLEGTFAAFADATAADMGIAGTATLTRSGSGTSVEVSVTGLTAGETYPAHVHALPCDVDTAGGHYKLDPSVMDTVETNEIWPTPTVATDGAGMGSAMSDHVARPDAQSVVIHHQVDDAAPKVACADLRAAAMDRITAGDLTAFPLAAERGLDGASGNATMTRGADGTTTVAITLAGFTAMTEYGIHVHDRPCDVASGGGHYKLDPSVMDTVEANEIWLTFTTDAAGGGENEVAVDHLARAEAQALVVHDTDGERLACVDLR